MRKLETGIFFVVKTTRLRARNLHGCTRIRGFHFDDPVKILPRPYSQSPRLFPRDFSLFFTTHALSPYRWNDTARTATRAHSFPQHGEIEISMGGGGGRLNESHCIKADGSQRCRISEVLLFYRPSGVASSFSMPLSPLSMQPSTLVSLPPFSTSPLRFFFVPSLSP